jgi:hypothetical protein
MKKTISAIISFLTLAPAIAFAQIQTTPLNNANDLATRIQSIGNVVIELLISLAIIWIIISVIAFLISSANKAMWRSNVLWGIVGLVIITSVWGLVYLIRNTFNTGTNSVNQQDVPRVLPISGQNVYGQ